MTWDRQQEWAELGFIIGWHGQNHSRTAGVAHRALTATLLFREGATISFQKDDTAVIAQIKALAEQICGPAESPRIRVRIIRWKLVTTAIRNPFGERARHSRPPGIKSWFGDTRTDRRGISTARPVIWWTVWDELVFMLLAFARGRSTRSADIIHGGWRSAWWGNTTISARKFNAVHETRALGERSRRSRVSPLRLRRVSTQGRIRLTFRFSHLPHSSDELVYGTFCVTISSSACFSVSPNKTKQGQPLPHLWETAVLLHPSPNVQSRLVMVEPASSTMERHWLASMPWPIERIYLKAWEAAGMN
jgi:hypothetical protein